LGPKKGLGAVRLNINKMPEKKGLELRSEEVQELLTRVPHWMIRWGNVVILFILFIFLGVSWFIRYPDVIAAPIIITTNIPPEKLIAKTSGKIEAIFVTDRAIISKNVPLAVIESAANYKDVFLLKSIMDSIIISKNNFPFHLIQSAQLGDVESDYALFQKEYMAANLNEQLQPYKVEGTSQSIESIQLKERLNLLQSQKEINLSELELQKNDLKRYETLFSKGIISTQEIEKQKLIYLQAEKNYKSVLSSISQLKSSINDLNRNSKTTQINETKEGLTLERNVIQSFYQLKKAIKNWELNYVFRSSINGTVSFLQVWKENQTVVSGDNIFAIIPSDENGYLGKIKAPALNSGKIKVGQEVTIRLSNYPDREFGTLKGKVKAISLVPDKDGNLLMDISLPKQLLTSYNKVIPFQQEMAGQAEIITEDLRLLERFLYQFRDVFKN
jgi:multidrug efflux pump subunit AcrA (membrane-fusion protein)